MLTSKNARVSDDANFIHGCFMVRVGSDFKTYEEIIRYTEQSETYGTPANPAISSQTAQILQNRSSSGASLPAYYSKRKCRDSSLGGNDAINPLPQFGPDDDIRHPFLQPFSASSDGMGQVYSENFDDNQQILYMSFGIPVFSNLGNFWSTAVDQDLAKYVNKGYGITPEKIGYLLASTPIKLIRIATIPFKFIAAIADRLQNVQIDKYYSFSSQMPMYFRFVNSILVSLATNMNIVGSSDEFVTTGSDVSNTTSIGLLGEGTSPTDDTKGIPTVFREHGLDMAKLMTKLYLYENGKNPNIVNRNTDDAVFESSKRTASLAENWEPPEDQATNGQPVGDDTAAVIDTMNRTWSMNWFDSFATAYGNTIYDGHLFIGFRVEKGASTSESFSNSTGESKVAAAANSAFETGKDAAFSTMYGKFGQGALSQMAAGAVGLVKGVLDGVTSAISADALSSSLTGAAKIVIPEVWQTSGYSRSASFTINCTAPYGDFESIFQSNYVPLACVLAGTLPRGTGVSSHSSPFICQAYCRGMFASPLCIVESLQVTRGADQFGFNAARLPLEISMELTLKDLSPSMYMTMAGDKGIAAQIFGSDDNFGEYMLTLSGMGLRERLSPFKSIRRKTQILLSTIYNNKLSPFMVGMDAGARLKVSRMISAVVSGGKGLPRN